MQKKHDDMKKFCQWLTDKLEVADDVTIEQLMSTTCKAPALTQTQLEHCGYGAELIRQTIKRIDQLVEA